MASHEYFGIDTEIVRTMESGWAIGSALAEARTEAPRRSKIHAKLDDSILLAEFTYRDRPFAMYVDLREGGFTFRLVAEDRDGFPIRLIEIDGEGMRIGDRTLEAGRATDRERDEALVSLAILSLALRYIAGV